MKADVIQRWLHPQGVIEVLRLPGGRLVYRSSAAGYSLYTDTPDQAHQALAHLSGDP